MQTKRGRWVWVIPVILSLAWIGLPAFAEDDERSQAKVAVVNGSVITQEDFEREIIRVQRRFASMGKSFDQSQLPIIKREILQGLIHAELLYQESEGKGVRVEEAAIDEQLNRMKKRLGNEDKFKTELTRMNISEAQLRSQIKRSLVIQKFIVKQFIEKATASTQEVRAYYDSHPYSFKRPELVRASHILIKIDPQADESQRAETRKKIEQILHRVQQGEDFATLAKEFSQDPSSTKGGDLGYFSRGQMVKPFEEAAFALTPGEVSDLVETRFGYHLIKVFDKKEETTIPYEDIKERIERYVKDKKVETEVGRYVQRLRESAEIETFLAETQKK